MSTQPHDGFVLSPRTWTALRDSTALVGYDPDDPRTQQEMVEHAVRLWAFVLMERCITASTLMLYQLDGPATVLQLKVDSPHQRNLDHRVIAAVNANKEPEAPAAVEPEPDPVLEEIAAIEEPAPQMRRLYPWRLAWWQRQWDALPDDRSFWFVAGMIAICGLIVTFGVVR